MCKIVLSVDMSVVIQSMCVPGAPQRPEEDARSPALEVQQAPMWVLLLTKPSLKSQEESSVCKVNFNCPYLTDRKLYKNGLSATTFLLF